MSDLIALEGVSKSYRRGREQVHALREVSLQIAAGEFVAVTGPSGSGKSTLLNLIGCLDRPESGKLRIDHADTGALGERELTRLRSEKIGFVFQQFFLQPTLTALENVLVPTIFASRNGSDAERRARELLTRVGLAERAKHYPAQLSGGEMQRVAIARALINQPQILLADEPTGSLDTETAAQIVGIIRELNAGGLTVILVTHQPELAAQAARRFTLRDGRVSQDHVCP